jgi:hypothetical protein
MRIRRDFSTQIRVFGMISVNVFEFVFNRATADRTYFHLYVTPVFRYINISNVFFI